MDVPALIKTDLNLLVTLYVLYEEGSVSRAADRLCITQSAVSKALSRMRNLFHDPLFTRAGHQLIPTPMVENLAPLLTSTLNDVDSILRPGHFEPKSWEGCFKIAFTEMVEMALMPKLLTYLKDNAPGVHIEGARYTSNTLEKLPTAELDFCINWEYDQYPEGLRIDPFLISSFVIMARADHPLKNKCVDTATVTRYPRVSLQAIDWERTQLSHTVAVRRDDIVTWKILYETNGLQAALSCLKVTDALLPLPDIIVGSLLNMDSFRFYTLSDYANIKPEYVTVSHARTAHSPAHIWFRQVLREIGKEIFSDRDKLMKQL